MSTATSAKTAASAEKSSACQSNLQQPNLQQSEDRQFRTNQSKRQQKLLQHIKAGDPQAIKTWFDRLYPQLFRMALSKVKAKKDAEDLVQETFVNAVKQLHLFRGEASLKTWMANILRHEIADYYRKKYAKRAIKTTPLSELLRSDKLLDSSHISQKIKHKVQKVLGKMLERRKKLLLMKYVDELSVKTIAQRVGRTFKAVESDLYRARESFKQLYASVE
jgi:RNA polymerase sigma-70 factor (ECF subfamily)